MNPEGKKSRGRPRLRWEKMLKVYLQGIEWKGADWIDLAWDRDTLRAVLNAVMNLRIP
jgi:hypothetical protein